MLVHLVVSRRRFNDICIVFVGFGRTEVARGTVGAVDSAESIRDPTFVSAEANVIGTRADDTRANAGRQCKITI